MINKWVAYDVEQVKKKYSLAKIKRWWRAGLITEDQWQAILQEYRPALYTPSIMMRILLFAATLIGISTILGPFFLIFDIDSESAFKFMLVLVGVASLLFIELKMIRNSQHYKSGVTEAGYYVGLIFIYFGILGFDEQDNRVYAVFALLAFVFASVRYLDLLALAAAVACLVILLFLVLESLLTFMPFLIMTIFLILFFLSRRLQQKADMVLWDDHFIVFDSLALLLVYLGGNYFVVREMSIEMMDLQLNEGQDIPFAFVFYALTFLIPFTYLFIGVLKKKVMLIRVGVLTILLSVITIKYYYSIGYPEITVTIAGGFLIMISLALMKYLKTSRRGYTREKLLSSKWDDSNLAAFIAAQTLGGHAVAKTEKYTGKGGEFGGGGASGEF